MIEILRNNKQVELKLTSPIPYNTGPYVFTFTWNCNSETYAGLLVKQFEDTMWDRLKRIRREAYNQGWKDARAKNKKEDWFNGTW